MKRLTALAIALTLIIPYLCVSEAEAYTDTLGWDNSSIYITYDKRYMPYAPEDKLTPLQNPPSFTWPYVKNAVSYDIKVCADKELTDIKYSKDNIGTNFYCFDRTFNTGVDYYWAVRYRTASGEISCWSDVRRFRIDPDASEFPVDDIDTIMKRLPSKHPRVWTTPDNLADFRAYADTNDVAKRVKDNVLTYANSYMNAEVPKEPTEFGSVALSTATKMTGMIQYTAFAYLLTEDEKYGEYAIKLMDSVSKWSWDDTTGPTSYKQHDQAHRDIALKCAMAYDWVYDLISLPKHSAERASVVNMITERTKKMTGLIDSLKKEPYNSHGWTALGYIGIISIAMHGEIPEADTWLRGVVPLYTAIIPPWSGQSGGWSQGTDYWQYSTNQGGEFIDVLALSGMLNLYNCAWLQNQYLWSLYAYPEGSYGSFGDQSNRTKAETGGNTALSMGRLAAFTDNPVTKWISEQTGGLSNTPANYYISQNSKTSSRVPDDYPLSHEFKDIGWAVMTNSLTDTDRVQLTFKSSPWGSYNHSHADQNSFIIQAYGENLAIKSGYYDSYHTAHDNAITRKTFTHNTITTDDTDGQAYYTAKNGSNDRFDAKGHLLQFVNQISFDSVTGDATEAYMDSPAGNTKAIGKYVRNIIYIRPDVFIVVDDLAAKDGDESSFKWWLNSEHQPEYGDNYAVISEGNARLRADVLYPSNTKATYYDGFYELDGTHVPADGGAGSYIGKNEQRRISFATPKCSSTKMITAMSVYKSDGEAKLCGTSYSSDNSCVKLSYASGVTVLVNLTDGTAKYDNIEFDGAAVTYDDDSVMLTNGTRLVKDGNTLIQTSGKATVAIGGGQLCFSADDDMTLTANSRNGYFDTSDISSLRDDKGRALSPSIGIKAENVDNCMRIEAQKGSYTVLESEDNPISVLDMTPKGLSLSKDGSDLILEWKESGNCVYDAEVNGTVYTNVSSPYIFKADDYTSVRIRARMKGIVGDWSGSAVYDPSEPINVGKVTYNQTEDGEMTAEIYVTGVPQNKTLYTAVYTKRDRLTAINSERLKSGLNTIKLDGIDKGAQVRTFIIDNSDGAPLISSADYGTDTTDLVGIYVNGTLIDGFSNEKEEYTTETDETINSAYPTITARAADASSRVIVCDNQGAMSTEIKVISPSGKERSVKINFTSKRGILHRVDGAEEDADFVADNYASSGVVSYNKGVFSYKRDGEAETINLPLYSKTKTHGGGYDFGSHLCSDRPTTSGNRMEINTLPEYLCGWDYFVLPQAYYYDKDECEDEKFTFELSHDAEVTILAIGEVDSLLNNGFGGSMGSFGTARYMNSCDDADAYYNIEFNGISVDEIDKNNRPVNYDVACRMINVKPFTKLDESGKEVNWTKEDYETNKPSKEEFQVISTGESWITNYKFTYKYTKSFSASADAKAKVELDLTDIGNGKVNDKLLIIIKNAEPKAQIENLKYLGPKTFDEIRMDLSGECTDDYDNKKTFGFLSSGIMGMSLTDGAQAYAQSGNISMIDDFAELEGAYYFTFPSDLLTTAQNSAWMRAYYYGTDTESGYEYPGLYGKTHDWYSFEINTSAYLYVVTAGKTPKFIDSSWEKVESQAPMFDTYGVIRSYRTVYRKYVNVNNGEKEKIVMQTPGVRGAAYYLLVKPVKK